ncbi:MAG: hypothetical protein ACOC8B_05630, partial [Gemmatimonadota bacterium]
MGRLLIAAAAALTAPALYLRLTAIPLAAPVEVVHKRRWWNLLFGNPAGYLPDGQPVEAVTVDLPARDLVGIGPDWLRGWEPAFFVALLVVSISLKFT